MEYREKIIYVFLSGCLLWGQGLWGQKPELVVQTGHSLEINSAVFSPNGDFLLTGGDDKIAILWNSSGQEIQRFIGHDSQVWSVAFSPDADFILTGSSDKTAKLWDISGNELNTFTGHNAPISSVA
ncbi:MAG: hypothetical protein H6558_08365 [Lewinellaceae bacterium]|nr:hypothetical protein [Lewinellaceae bacterium]